MNFFALLAVFSLGLSTWLDAVKVTIQVRNFIEVISLDPGKQEDPSNTCISGSSPTLSQITITTPPAATTHAAPAHPHYVAMILHHHNVHRANHSAPELAWNQSLANAAQDWAANCNFKHHVYVLRDTLLP